MNTRGRLFGALSVTVMALIVSAPALSGGVPPAPNGIVFPEAYKDWRVIAVSHRADNNSLRVILGNDAAIAAARAGQTDPWPDGAVLGKLVFKDASHEDWQAATVPGRFVHAEFMVKDAKQYAGTGGWGYARWLGQEQTPYGKDPGFAQECYDCHAPVKANDYVFTRPMVLP